MLGEELFEDDRQGLLVLLGRLGHAIDFFEGSQAREHFADAIAVQRRHAFADGLFRNFYSRSALKHHFSDLAADDHQLVYPHPSSVPLLLAVATAFTPSERSDLC